MGIFRDCCLCTAKTVLIVINLVFWIIAGVLIYIAATLLSQYQMSSASVTGAEYIVAPAVLFIFIGVILLFTGALSCCAVTNNNKCLAVTFFILMLCIIILQAVVVIFVYTERDQMTDSIYKGLNETYNRYTESEYTQTVDKLQEFFRCCGVVNYTDWARTPWGKGHPGRVPMSCCVDSSRQICSAYMNKTQLIYTEGCGQRLEDIFIKSSDTSAWVAMGFAIFEVFGLLAAIVIISNYKRKVPYLDLDSDRPFV